MNYLTETRNFVDELMKIQKYIRDKKQYQRADQRYLNKVMEDIESYFKLHLVDTENKMLRFWELNWRKVKILLPSVRYPGFAKLLIKFEEIDTYTKNEIWNSLTQKLN